MADGFVLLEAPVALGAAALNRIQYDAHLGKGFFERDPWLSRQARSKARSRACERRRPSCFRHQHIECVRPWRAAASDRGDRRAHGGRSIAVRFTLMSWGDGDFLSCSGRAQLGSDQSFTAVHRRAPTTPDRHSMAFVVETSSDVVRAILRYRSGAVIRAIALDRANVGGYAASRLQSILLAGCFQAMRRSAHRGRRRLTCRPKRAARLNESFAPA